jgi:ferric-dicitrate binding protein FerR (iron transport regulator)
MSRDRAQELLEKLLNDRLSDGEADELSAWVNTLGDRHDCEARLEALWNDFHPEDAMDADRADQILDKIFSRSVGVPQNTHRKTRLFSWKAAAAIAVILAGSLLLVLGPGRKAGDRHTPGLSETLIRPGGKRAFLHIAGKTTIALDSLATGTALPSGAALAVKTSSGLISYESGKRPAVAGEVSQNTVSTPRGGEYEVQLTDGTRVWLNAASSVSFPAVFSGDERKITVTGEVYLEVAQKANRPFIVSIATPEGKDLGTVQVLGTHFNINAYQDEDAVRTTLLEGSVRVLHEGDSKLLRPDDQAEITGQRAITVHQDVDVTEAVAWKNGYFDFQETDIASVMRQVSRWYDVDIVYQDTTPAHFLGTISRKVALSEVLKMLELTGVVHFDVSGKTITVVP